MCIASSKVASALPLCRSIVFGTDEISERRLADGYSANRGLRSAAVL